MPRLKLAELAKGLQALPLPAKRRPLPSHPPRAAPSCCSARPEAAARLAEAGLLRVLCQAVLGALHAAQFCERLLGIGRRRLPVAEVLVAETELVLVSRRDGGRLLPLWSLAGG